MPSLQCSQSRGRVLDGAWLAKKSLDVEYNFTDRYDLMIGVVLYDEHILFGPLGRSALSGCDHCQVTAFVHPDWDFVGKTKCCGRRKDCSWFQIVVWELRLCTTDTRHTSACFRGLSVPQDAVAWGACEGPTASKVVEQTSVALTKLCRGDFVGEVHVAGATCLCEAREECLRSVQLIEG